MIQNGGVFHVVGPPQPRPSHAAGLIAWRVINRPCPRGEARRRLRGEAPPPTRWSAPLPARWSAPPPVRWGAAACAVRRCRPRRRPRG